MSKELEWWANHDESLLGVVSLDLIDHDYSLAILGRDEQGLFRAIDVMCSLDSVEAARKEIEKRVGELSVDNPQEFPQGDNDRKKHEILVPCVPTSKLNRVFEFLLENEGYSPARGILKELSYAFTDLDGNYKKDFQTTGFEGRLWELFLYAYLYEEKFQVDEKYNVPDFIVQKGSHRVAIEAVTVNPTDGVVGKVPSSVEEERMLCLDYMPIKWGSALFSKLRKRYWEKKPIVGLPLVFAIHDFHGEGSMTWSLPALSDYLFGVRSDETGRDYRVLSHHYEGKEIPSGFFNLPDAENVSAVIASNEATLTKFNRMGKIAGFGDSSISMTRYSAALDLETNETGRFKFETEVGIESENWGSGIWVFHNPNANVPLDENIFHGALNVYLEDGQRSYWSSRKFHVIRSMTSVITSV